MHKLDVWPLLTDGQRQAVLKSRELYAQFQTTETDPIAKMRAAYNFERRFWNSFPVELHAIEDLRLATPDGELSLRLYRPSDKKNLPVLIYAHGGGMILGDLDTHDRVQRLLAKNSGWAVLAIDYSLAPEVKFPTQLHQILHVVNHVAQRGGDWGLDRSRIALGGDSAGAHFMLATALAARDAKGPELSALLLFYGAYGLKDSRAKRLYGWADLDGLTDAEVAFYRACYLRDPQDSKDPRYDLLQQNMTGLPPCYVLGVEFDPLYDDSVALVEMLQIAGVAHHFASYAGVLHSFLHYSAVEPKAHQALEESAAFLNRS